MLNIWGGFGIILPLGKISQQFILLMEYLAIKDDTFVLVFIRQLLFFSKKKPQKKSELV